MNKLKTLIVDDEPLNREELCFLLKNYDQIELVGEVETAIEAMAIIRHQNIDLLLLDIEMEEERAGLKLAEQFRVMVAPPSIIFVTAHYKYALESHNYEPLHYLLKPLNEEMLDEALQRAFRLRTSPKINITYRRVIDRTIIYPTAFVSPEEILYIHKNKGENTINLHLCDKEILTGVRESLDHFQQCRHLS